MAELIPMEVRTSQTCTKGYVRSYGDLSVTIAIVMEFHSAKVYFSRICYESKYLQRRSENDCKIHLNFNLPFSSNGTSWQPWSFLKSHLYTTPGLAICGTAELFAFGAPTRSLQRLQREFNVNYKQVKRREGKWSCVLTKNDSWGRNLQKKRGSRPKIQNSCPVPLV